ncbi:Ca(2+)-dependent cysteine protease [Exophiala oligosperma]
MAVQDARLAKQMLLFAHILPGEDEKLATSEIPDESTGIVTTDAILRGLDLIGPGDDAFTTPETNSKELDVSKNPGREQNQPLAIIASEDCTQNELEESSPSHSSLSRSSTSHNCPVSDPSPSQQESTTNEINFGVERSLDCAADHTDLAPCDNSPNVPKGSLVSIPERRKHIHRPRWSGDNAQMQKKAVFIGINYFGTRGELRGCVDDVKHMSAYLCYHFGYAREQMIILTDDQKSPQSHPTKVNILRAIHWLAKDAQPQDSLLLHYSGHDGYHWESDKSKSYTNNTCIYPLDFRTAGLITYDEVERIISSSLKLGVRFTSILDSCHPNLLPIFL